MTPTEAYPQYVFGVDLSQCQGREIDFVALYNEGARFAICKASEGLGTDPRFLQFVSGAQQAGLLVGAYHVFHARFSPREQAAHFASVCTGLDLALGPWMDWELMDGISPADNLSAGLVFLEEADLRFQRPVGIYTAHFFWHAFEAIAPVEIGFRALWQAQYGNTDANRGVPPKPLKPWDRWTIWQGRGTGGHHLPGAPPAVTVDEDFFDGDLRAWCFGSAAECDGVNVPVEAVDLDSGG